MKRPKLIVLLLAAGVLILGVGGAVAATRPSWPSHKAASALAAPAHQSAGSSAAPSPSTATPSMMATQDPKKAAATTAPKKPRDKNASKKQRPASKQHSKKHQVKRSVTYIVKPGDTLSGIAEWFKLHGYGALYKANWKVIGANPNLIIPGERITITDGVMTLSGTQS